MAPSVDRIFHVKCQNIFEGDLSADAHMPLCLQQPVVLSERHRPALPDAPGVHAGSPGGPGDPGRHRLSRQLPPLPPMPPVEWARGMELKTPERGVSLGLYQRSLKVRNEQQSSRFRLAPASRICTVHPTDTQHSRVATSLNSIALNKVLSQ
jgi:hypothetical protein